MNKEIYNVLCEMSEKEFISFLKNKYGENYLFQSLTPEEAERYMPPDLPNDEVIDDPLKFFMRKLPTW